MFGPRRRSFATKLQRKVYALAYRTAISWRFRNDQLMMTHPQFLEFAKTRYLLALLRKLRWTKTSGGVMFVTGKERKNLFLAARVVGEHVTVKRAKDLKVRDLLMRGRVVIERRALEWLIARFGVDTVARPKKDPIREYERLLKLL